MFSLSLYHLLPLLAVIPIVKSQVFFKAGGACTPLCENVYREAQLCKLSSQPFTLDPLGFNSTCLCNPETFRERAPGCIDCLFRNVIEEDAREFLQRGMDGCTKACGLPPCPKSCEGAYDLIRECGEEDSSKAAASSAAAAAAAAASQSAAEGLVSGEPTSPGATSTPTNGSIIGKEKRKVKEDHTNKCICKPENKATISKCYDCLKNYDVSAAENIILPVRRCDPNYGITGPLYRSPKLRDDDDDEDAEGGPRKGGRRNKKQKSLASTMTGQVLTMVWWIGVQILCVMGAVIYFAI